MDLENIRAANRPRPFRPYAIRTGSGESYPVRHPENISFSDDVSVVVVMPGPGQVIMIDLDSITEVAYDFRPKGASQGPA